MNTHYTPSTANCGIMLIVFATQKAIDDAKRKSRRNLSLECRRLFWHTIWNFDRICLWPCLH